MNQVNGHTTQRSAANGALTAIWGASEVGLVDILKVARRRWLRLSLCLLVGVAGALTYHYLTPPKYESRARIMVEQKNASHVTSGPQGNGANNGVTDDVMSTHIQLVQSRRILEDAVEAESLAQLPIVQSKLRKYPDPLDYFGERLFVTRGGKGQSKAARVLNIAFQHEDPVESRDIVKAIVASYQGFLRENFQDVNLEAVNLITKAKSELGGELEQAEENFRDFRRRAPLLWKGDQSANIHRDRYEQIQNELSTLQLQATEAKTRLTVVEEALTQYDAEGAGDLVRLSVIDEKNATRMGALVLVERGEAESAEFIKRQPERMEKARREYDTLVQLKVKLRTLLQDFGPEHPEVKTTTQQISIMEELLASMSGELTTRNKDNLVDPKTLVDAYVRILKHDIVSLDRKDQELAALADEEEEAAKSLISFELEGEVLRKDVARRQELYDTVVDRLREINLAKDFEGYFTPEIDRPQLGKQVWPKLPVSVVLGVLSGLALGVVAAALAEYRDLSFRTPDEIKGMLELPILGHVGRLDARKRRVARGSVTDASIVAYHQPKSVSAEAFRGLRTHLFFQIQGQKHPVLQCTSPDQGDGKSTVAANLAVSLAQSGRDVLLVDCDMRRPRVHKLFGVDGEQGLSNVLAEDLDPALHIQPTETERLAVLCCGSPPDNPAELLASPAFDRFLERIRDQYDVVLLDTPPLLPVADPCIIAPRMDGVILTIRIGGENRPRAMRAKEALDDASARVLGVVVNGTAAADGYGYGRYSYSEAYEAARR